MAGPATKAHFPVASESRSEASLTVKNEEMITVLFLFSMVCKIKMQELNALRMHSEELERLLQFASFNCS